MKVTITRQAFKDIQVFFALNPSAEAFDTDFPTYPSATTYNTAGYVEVAIMPRAPKHPANCSCEECLRAEGEALLASLNR